MISYLLYTFGIAWALWGIVILGIYLEVWGYGHPLAMLCYVLAIFAPGIGALIVKKKKYSTEQFSHFFKDIWNIAQPIKSYLLAVFLPIVFTALPVLTGGAHIARPLYLGFLLIVPMIIGGGLEEIGWRGFLQFELEKRFSVLTSTLMVATIWTLWHIPLWFIPWTNQWQWSFLFFFVNVLCFSFILTTVYHKTKSIFLCILCHATINAFWAIFPTHNQILPLLPGLFIAFYIHKNLK